MAKNEVVKTGALDLTANTALPDFLKGKMDDQRGNENVGNDDLTIPRIEICQSLSECRKKNSPEFIEGIQEGDLYNNVTRQIYGDSLLFVPVAYLKEYLLWRDLKAGGGFGGSYQSAELANIALEAMEEKDRGDYEIVDTPQHFVLVVDQETGKVTEAVISMAKSKAKVSRKFNSLIRLNEGPRFSRIYRLRGVADQNGAGQDFFNINVDNVSYVNAELFKRAEALYELIAAGKVQADRTVAKTTEEGGEF